MPAQRQTKQMQAIRDAFEQAARPLSIDELHTLASSTINTLGQRTVYPFADSRTQERSSACPSRAVPIGMNWPVWHRPTTTTSTAPAVIDISTSTDALGA